ncbi:MAG: hypothetical protein KDB65_13610 [Calditrichaeota bacterium]|nr:hypothetical protein [Calditrichota bacterium]MCB9367684.1 hypothetical protein [Calditrichota bacterium]
MRKTVLMGVMLVYPLLALAQLHSFVAAEYFFDTDPGEGNGTAISMISGDDVELDAEVSTSGLSPGVHKLHIRMQRDDGVWGKSVSRNVRIGVGTSFEAAEVFFDTDPGEGNGSSVAIAANGTIDLTNFVVPNIGSGFHDVNIRAYSGGTWSAPARRTIRLGSALIDGAEVYFDSDPGEGNGIPVDVGYGTDVAAYDSTVDVSAAGVGAHTMYLRFRGGGVWSFPIFRTIRIGDAVVDGENRITGGEFFIDVDPGEGNGCSLIAEDGSFDERDEAMRRYVSADLTLGMHAIGVRVKDAGDRWYGPLIDSVNVIETHLSAFGVEGTSGNAARLAWNTYPEALEYRVHYDSLETGPYTNFISVAPPDTFLEIEPDQYKQLFKVVAIQIAPEPCGESELISRIINNNSDKE